MYGWTETKFMFPTVPIFSIPEPKETLHQISLSVPSLFSVTAEFSALAVSI